MKQLNVRILIFRRLRWLVYESVVFWSKLAGIEGLPDAIVLEMGQSSAAERRVPGANNEGFG